LRLRFVLGVVDGTLVAVDEPDWMLEDDVELQSDVTDELVPLEL